MKIKSPILKMAINGILGAVIGMLAGALLGLVIFYLQELMCWLAQLGVNDELAKGSTYSSTYRCYNQFFSTTFLGMGAGTLIGAIMGSIVGLKKIK